MLVPQADPRAGCRIRRQQAGMRAPRAVLLGEVLVDDDRLEEDETAVGRVAQRRHLAAWIHVLEKPRLLLRVPPEVDLARLVRHAELLEHDPAALGVGAHIQGEEFERRRWLVAGGRGLVGGRRFPASGRGLVEICGRKHKAADRLGHAILRILRHDDVRCREGGGLGVPHGRADAHHAKHLDVILGVAAGQHVGRRHPKLLEQPEHPLALVHAGAEDLAPALAMIKNGRTGAREAALEVCDRRWHAGPPVLAWHGPDHKLEHLASLKPVERLEQNGVGLPGALDQGSDLRGLASRREFAVAHPRLLALLPVRRRQHAEPAAALASGATTRVLQHCAHNLAGQRRRPEDAAIGIAHHGTIAEHGRPQSRDLLLELLKPRTGNPPGGHAHVNSLLYATQERSPIAR